MSIWGGENMNIVFWLGIILVLAFVWFALCSLYKPIGSFLLHLFNDAKSKITNDEKEKEKNED